MGSGIMADFVFHKGLFGSSLANGTVGVLVRADEVPDGAGAAVTNDARRVASKTHNLWCIMESLWERWYACKTIQRKNSGLYADRGRG